MLFCRNEKARMMRAGGNKMKQWLKDVVHNCVVHPILPFLPLRVANWLHDKNGKWAFDKIEGKKKPIDKQLAEKLTGRKMLAFIDEALQKNPLKKSPNSPKDFDSDSTSMS